MNKPVTVGTKKASSATEKTKKKRSTKIVKGGKIKTKQSNESTEILKESTIPTNIAVATSESWSLTQSIRQFVRMEVEDALMKTNTKRELAHEASAKAKIGHNNEYVKLEDLHDIVNKLISQHTESIIKRNSEKIQETADKVVSLEETLNTLTDRIKSAEDSVSEMRKGFLPTSADFHRVGRLTGKTKPTIRFQLPNEEPFNKELFKKDSFNKQLFSKQLLNREPFNKEILNKDPFNKESFNKNLFNNELPFVPRSMPLFRSASKSRLPSGGLQLKSSDDSDDDSMDLDSNPSNTGISNEKTQLYDEILKKLVPKIRGKQSDPTSISSPSQLDVDPSMSSLEGEWQKRMAERRKIDANMLRYKKSPLTLQVDNQKNYFPNERPKTPPAPPTRSPPPRPVHPRLSRPVITKSSDEAQSDWLFEQ
ncbi:hypothetical protein KR032_011094 [Drosophila birchii]|nr:hypothetical protein KR032_011094 [Drosophila birchii]